jgi:hypothetical protein
MAGFPEGRRGMTFRLTLFKWIKTDEKEILNIVEHPFNTLEEATKFLDGVSENEYEIAKVFLGDSLVHSRDKKHRKHDQNFS